MAAKTPKNPYRLQKVMFKLFYKGKKNQNMERKNRKLRIQPLWKWHFSRLRAKNRQLKDLPQADFGRVPERILCR